MVLNPVSETRNWGMAGNVVANLKSLGAEKVETITPNYAIIKTRYVDQTSGYIVMRVDENDEVKVSLDLDDVPDVRQFAAIVISDYNKGFLSTHLITAIAVLAKRNGVPVFLDTKKLLGHWSEEITFVKINEKEYKAHEDSNALLGYCENLIVTLGARGAKWVNRDDTVCAEPIEVADVSGCGDSFLAGFVLKWLWNGGNVVTAMEYANRVARIAASKRGVVAVKAEEVEA
jgi:D-beta-D-heptose 7-phosphate kinase/D-beta-D-heptose 1-phosphate adenosyltransferase